MTEYRRDTWAASRKFNPEAAPPANWQQKTKHRPKKPGKRQQLLAAALDELLEYRKFTDRIATEVLSSSKPNKSPTKKLIP
jgi:hypothetical protein